MASKSVNNKNISFIDFDSIERNTTDSRYSWLEKGPSAEEVIVFLKLKIRADKDIATYCLTAFVDPNTAILPWL